MDLLFSGIGSGVAADAEVPESPFGEILSGCESSVRTVRSLAEVETAWRALERACANGTVYQGFDWCNAWVEACRQIGEPAAVRIVVVSTGARVVLIWPLVIGRVGPFRVLHALGEPATQFCDLLVQPGPDADHFVELAWRHVTRLGGVDAVYLHQVRVDSPLNASADFSRQTMVLQQELAPLLPLKSGPADAKAPAVKRSGATVNALKRHLRKLAAAGPVAVEAVPPNRHAETAVEALALKSLWQQQRGLASSGYRHHANRALILSLAQNGVFHVFRLKLGETTAAIEIGAVWHRHYYSLIQSYDLKLAAHAPGRLLTWMLLDGGYIDADRIEFLPPAQRHKTEWTSLAIPVADRIATLNQRGKLVAWYLRSGRNMLKSLFFRLPCALRTRLLQSGR